MLLFRSHLANCRYRPLTLNHPICLCAIDAGQAKINYLEDAVTRSRCIVDMPLTECILDKTCSETEPAPFLESITEIPANGNFFSYMSR